MPNNNETTTSTYELTFANGSIKNITVPSSWKVTFGPAYVPNGTRPNAVRRQVPMAIRFYETKDRQKAIFLDVISFLDTSLDIDIVRPATPSISERASLARTARPYGTARDLYTPYVPQP